MLCEELFWGMETLKIVHSPLGRTDFVGTGDGCIKIHSQLLGAICDDVAALRVNDKEVGSMIGMFHCYTVKNQLMRDNTTHDVIDDTITPDEELPIAPELSRSKRLKGFNWFKARSEFFLGNQAKRRG